ncbi:Small acidic protein [Branchiostoma belcheri]|nr:Small acidic protein [Branchiostoma belcheri]
MRMFRQSQCLSAAKAVPTTSHDAPSGVRTDSQGDHRCHGNGYQHPSTSRSDVKQTIPSCAPQLMTKKGAQPAWTARHGGKHHPDMCRHGYTAGNKRLTSQARTLTSRPTPLEVLQKVKSKRAVAPKANTETKRQHSVWSSDSESESSDDECWCLECFKCRLMGSAVPHEDRLAVKKEIAVKQQSSLGRDSVSSSPQFFNDSSRQGDTRTETSKRVHSDSTSDSCKRIKLSGQSYEMTSRDSYSSNSTGDVSERSDVTDSLGRWQESRRAQTNEQHTKQYGSVEYTNVGFNYDNSGDDNVTVVSVKEGNPDVVLGELEREKRATERGRASPPLAGPRRHSTEIRWEGGTSNQSLTPIVKTRQWSIASLGSVERQQKFFRLLGGMKSTPDKDNQSAAYQSLAEAT